MPGSLSIDTRHDTSLSVRAVLAETGGKDRAGTFSCCLFGGGRVNGNAQGAAAVRTNTKLYGY